MRSYINEHQLCQIISHVSKQYETYAVQKKDDNFVINELKSPHFPIPARKTTNSFKEIIWPSNQRPKSKKNRKVAFLGMTNCDTQALNIFLEEFAHTDLLPNRENILIVSAECSSDEYCFCTALTSEISGYDLHLQTEKKDHSIFSGTKKGEQIMKNIGIRSTVIKPKLHQIQLTGREPINQNQVKEAVADFALYHDFWQKIANNCFGCGSCTAVCPLCFCTKQEEKNQIDKSAETCLEWDSCFAKSFSEIQNHQDMRPKRIKRLYNWYHHKFVRAFENKKHFLCTGCGRCINSCPAHLNQYKIISSVTSQEEKISHE